ncbi:MAG: DUF58 domain-containing protein [Myxococcales bacterium FL481]|nr:MAG: DUF58 domain-containing protein [Myxococcales bacterium FL481]
MAPRTPTASRSPASAEARERTLELIREVRRIEIQTSRLVDQHLAGSYQSAFKGQGVAFAEVRAYEPGDDVRTIDWNVTARTGIPHIKLFSEERELTVMLVVDMSASLDLGSRDADKRRLVARLAATFAFSAIRNNDSVGLLGFTDRVEAFVPPRSGRKHVLAVVQRVLSHEPSGRGTDPAAALEYMARIGRRNAVVIVISDFLDAVGPEEDSRFERALKLVRRGNDVIPVRVEDPLELGMPALGLVAVEDLELLELGGDRFIDLSRGRQARFKAEVQRERERFDALMRRLRLETMTVSCGTAWQQPLVQFFRHRARRMRR